MVKVRNNIELSCRGCKYYDSKRNICCHPLHYGEKIRDPDGQICFYWNDKKIIVPLGCFLLMAASVMMIYFLGGD